MQNRVKKKILYIKDDPFKIKFISSVLSVTYFTNKRTVEVELLIENDEANFVIWQWSFRTCPNWLKT